MTAETTGTTMPYGSWPTLLAAWQGLLLPAGWRAEIVGEGIIMTPPPGSGHNLIASRVDRALSRVVPEDWEICQTLGLSIPMRSKLFVPDLVVLARTDLVAGVDSEPVPAERARLVVEITSHGNADTDRKTKRWGYAHAAVPQYLLIDRFDEDGPSVTLFSDPIGGHYQHLVRIPFGEKLALPEPFGLDLDTGEFARVLLAR